MGLDRLQIFLFISLTFSKGILRMSFFLHLQNEPYTFFRILGRTSPKGLVSRQAKAIWLG